MSVPSSRSPNDEALAVSGGKNPLARSRAARGTSFTSDLFRVREVFLACVVGAAALIAVLAASPASVRAPGPLPRPHQKLACASCHDAQGGASKACGGCHAPHPSTRAGHRALAQQGKLGCTTCHGQHEDAQGITFEANGAVVRWANGGETTGSTKSVVATKTTVPLVPTSACRACHDLRDAADPAARCVANGWDKCFDEHQKVDESLAAKGVCAKQHGANRVTAWDAAAVAAAEIKPPEPPSRATKWSAWLGIPAFAALFSLVLTRSRRRRKQEKAALPIAAPVAAENRKLPVIDTSTCVGCYACVDACPFDVLTIEKYVAVVAKPDDCCGVILCAQVCPNGSLQIAEGEAIENRPNVDASLESADAPNVFLAGDLTGLPLIKNAIAQGTRVVDVVAERVKSSKKIAGVFDVAIVGSGPAGLAAALRAIEKGLSYVVLEQDTMAASIQSFPRNKLVFDQPMHLPVVGDLWLKESTKEELLAQWSLVVRKRGLVVREHHRVTGFQHLEDRIEIEAVHDGETLTVEARHVVLATGRRGSPKKLDAPIAPDAIPNVFYSLADARTFAGKKILVVGLGDSAMEAAVALAKQPGTEVSMSYRGKDFARGKARNVEETRALAAKGRIRIHFESTVKRVDHGAVVLDVRGAARTLKYDAILVLIGGTRPTALLQAAGVTWGAHAHHETLEKRAETATDEKGEIDSEGGP